MDRNAQQKLRSDGRTNNRRAARATTEEDDEPGTTHTIDANSQASGSRISSSRERHLHTTRQEQRPTPTYPSPKTFPERLMLVLEGRACPETIWWEDGGKTVALRIDNLKGTNVLAEHFQGIRYKFFIRNFSRWGFKRKTDFSVPYGLFHYQNSLFQKDRPYLVKHMRMDSDVQNVFAQHESEAGNNQQQNQDDTAAGQQPSNLAQNTAELSSLQNQQEASMLPSQASSVSGGTQQPNNNPAAGLVNQQQPAPSQASALLSSFLQQRQQNQPPELNNNYQSTLIHQITDLAGQFLNEPATQSPEYASLRGIVSTLQILGQQHLEGGGGHLPSAEGSSGSVPQHVENASHSSMDHPVPQSNSSSSNPATSSANNARNISDATLFQLITHLAGQQQVPGLDSASAARLHEYLISAPQHQHQQQQQQPVPAPPVQQHSSFQQQQQQALNLAQVQGLLGLLQQHMQEPQAAPQEQEGDPGNTQSNTRNRGD